MDNDAKDSLRSGTRLAFHLLRKAEARNRAHNGAPGDQPTQIGSKPLLTLAVAATVIGVGVLIALGIIAGMLKLFEYGVDPLVSYVGGRLFPLLFVPGALPALAVAVLVVGLLFAPKFRDPGLFVMGLFGPILAIVGLWQLPRLIGMVRARGAEGLLEGPLLIVALIVCAFLFVGGLQLMGTSEWIGNQTVSDDDDE